MQNGRHQDLSQPKVQGTNSRIRLSRSGDVEKFVESTAHASNDPERNDTEEEGT